jgi:hypothetical protein
MKWWEVLVVELMYALNRQQSFGSWPNNPKHSVTTWHHLIHSFFFIFFL